MSLTKTMTMRNVMIAAVLCAVMLALASAQTLTPLTQNVPFYSSVLDNNYAYFSVAVTGTTSYINIALTVLSGGARMYVSSSWNPQPGPSNYLPGTYSYLGFDSFARASGTYTAGTFYIGINGLQSNSSFSILASVRGALNATNVITPITSNPQAGGMVQYQAYYYSFTLPVTIPSLTFTLMNLFGDVNLYVNRNNLGTAVGSLRLPAIGNGTFYADYSSFLVGADMIFIANPPAGIYTILVYLPITYEAEFVLRVTRSDDVTVLQNALTVSDVAFNNTMRKYVFYSTGSKPIQVSLTLLGVGNVDLYIARTYQPNTTTSVWKSAGAGNDYITIPTTDPNFCVVTSSSPTCVYYITVYAAATARYTISASSTDQISLLKNTFYTGQTSEPAYFIYQPSSLDADIQIALSMNYYYAYMYMSVTNQFPSPQNFNSSVLAVTTSLISVLNTAPLSCKSRGIALAACRFYVAVLPYNTFDPAIFSIMVTEHTNTSLIQLGTNGATGQRSLAGGQWDYFYTYIFTPNQLFLLGLNNIVGDVDIYVSSRTERPSLSNYQYMSRLSGSDVLSIRNISVGVWYIAIENYATITSTYTLTTSLYNPDAPTTAYYAMGSQLTQFVAAGSMRNLAIYSSSPNATFLIESLTGSSTMYMNLPKPGSVVIVPNTTSYDRMTLAGFNSFVSTVNTITGYYVLSIRSNVDSMFRLTTAYVGQTTVLGSGTERLGLLQTGQVNYYSFTVTVVDTRQLSFYLRTISGNPDMYIAYGFLPSRTMYNYTASRAVGSEFFVLTSATGLRTGIYYVAVFGSSASTQYGITVTYSLRPQLSATTPVAAFIPAGGVAYYDYYVVNNTESFALLLATTPTIYQPADWYMSFTGTPSIDSYQQYTAGTIGVYQQQMRISTATVGNCGSPCRYQFLAVAKAASSTFTTVTIQRFGQATLLVSGESFYSFIYLSNQYYAIQVFSPNQNLVVGLSVFSGDVNLYISRDVQPNVTSYQWKSDLVGTDIIGIYNATVGTYYITVVPSPSYTQSYYQVQPTIYTSGVVTAKYVYAGNPDILDVAFTGEYRYYYVYSGSLDGTLTVSVTSVLGEPDMYMNNPGGVWPSNTSSTYKSALNGNDVIIIPSSVVGYYMLAVYARSTTTYRITATLSGYVTPMVVNGYYYGSGNEGQMFYYRLTIPAPLVAGRVLVFTLDSYNGNADMFITNTTTRPDPNDPTTYKWALQEVGDDNLVISNTTGLQPGVYTIGVLAKVNSTAYYLVARYSNSINLIYNRPQLWTYVTSYYNQYFDINIQKDDTFTLYIDGDSDYNMYVQCDGSLATPTNYQQASFAVEGDQTKPATSLNIPSSTCTTTVCSCSIFVTGTWYRTYMVSFYISAVEPGALQQLVIGSSVQRTTLSNQTTYYSFSIAVAQTNVLLAINALAGDPDVYVSMTPNPSSTNYFKKSESYGSDVIGFRNISVGTWYVAVYAWGTEDATYKLKFSTMATVYDYVGVGTTIYDFVGEGMWHYYNVWVDGSYSPQTVTLQLTAQIGDPDIYVNIPRSNYIYPAYPTIDSNDVKGENYGNDFISFYVNVSSYVRIGVYGYQDSVYTLAIGANGSVQALGDGYTYTNYLSYVGDRSYYTFTTSTLLNGVALVFVVTPLSGNPDIVCGSVNPRPDPAVPSSYEFSSNENALNMEFIVISNGTTPALKANTVYYCAVVAKAVSTQFTISARYRARSAINAGVPLFIYSYNGLVDYYDLYMRGGQDFTITFNSISATGMTLFVNNGGDVLPTIRSNNYLQYPDSLGVTSISIPQSACPSNTTTCRYIIGAQSSVSYSYGYLVAQGANEITFIEENQGLTRDIAVGTYQRYQFTVRDAMANITVSLTSLSGNPDLYMSRSSFVSKDSFEWNSTAKGSAGDVIFLPYNSPSLGSSIVGQYYIAVFAVTAATYTITISSVTNAILPTQLIANAPRFDIVNAQSVNYYSFLAERTYWPYNISMSLTPSAVLGLYVRDDNQPSLGNSLPTAVYNQWGISVASGTGSILIAAYSVNSCDPTNPSVGPGGRLVDGTNRTQCYYTLAVVNSGATSQSFTVVVNLLNTTRPVVVSSSSSSSSSTPVLSSSSAVAPTSSVATSSPAVSSSSPAVPSSSSAVPTSSPVEPTSSPAESTSNPVVSSSSTIASTSSPVEPTSSPVVSSSSSSTSVVSSSSPVVPTSSPAAPTSSRAMFSSSSSSSSSNNEAAVVVGGSDDQTLMYVGITIGVVVFLILGGIIAYKYFATSNNNNEYSSSMNENLVELNDAQSWTVGKKKNGSLLNDTNIYSDSYRPPNDPYGRSNDTYRPPTF